jgi:hypothetical protein
VRKKSTHIKHVDKLLFEILSRRTLHLQDEPEIHAVQGGIDLASSQHGIIGSPDVPERLLGTSGSGRERDDLVEDVEVCFSHNQCLLLFLLLVLGRSTTIVRVSSR